MLRNPWTFLVIRSSQTTRLLFLSLALFGILGLLIRILFNSTSLDICFPKSNIVFLKIHKCAGSSIQNILMRYGDAHNLTFVLPKDGHYLGHPNPFSRTMVPPPFLFSYNIFAHHARLDYKEIQAVMPSNSIYISIKRDPVEVFESAFSFYGLSNIVGSDLHQFLVSVPNISSESQHKRFVSKFGSNQMLFHLGADPGIFHNDSLVKQYINKLDSWFHLILIADRMDESLILLRHLMCWDIDDVVMFKLNARHPKFKNSLNEKEIVVLRELNHADVLLYNHFVKKFDKSIEAFGRSRMTEETEQLRERTQKWYDLCVKGEELRATLANINPFHNPKVMVLNANTNSSNTCKSMTIEEPQYTDILRQKQKARLPHTFYPTFFPSRKS